MQELKEELKENNMKWDVTGLGDARRKEESFATLQSGHLLYHSKANNGDRAFHYFAVLGKKLFPNVLDECLI